MSTQSKTGTTVVLNPRWTCPTAAKRIAVLILFCLLGPLVLLAQQLPLPAAIDELLQHPAAQQAFWGVHIRDLDSGEIVYDHNGGKLFLPASNAKLFSTALGLMRLGPDHHFTTSVVSTVPATPDGVVRGDLILLGGGDPNLSSRLVPYNPHRSFDPDAMLPLAELARQIAEAGIRRVEGNLIGDDTRYVRQSIADGWSWRDTNWGYGAPVGALCFNDNLLDIYVQPGAAPGRAGRLTLRPDFDYFRIENRIRTAATRTVAQALDLERDGGTRTVSLWGEISIRSRGRTFSVAVDDPALFAAYGLRSELAKRGIEITGEVASRHAWPWEHNSLKRASFQRKPPAGVVVASIQSARLLEGLRIINKESQNLHAEMLLREVGFAVRNIGSEDAGLEELEDFLVEAGISKREFEFSDASGLSRKDLISPAATVQLLAYMWNTPHRADYVGTLPLSGEDGTLDWRFSRTAARGRVRAKTGTLSHVTALSGYATSQDGRHLAFSIYVNNFTTSGSYVRRLVDRIVLEMIEPHPGDAEEVTSGASGVTGSAK